MSFVLTSGPLQSQDPGANSYLIRLYVAGHASVCVQLSGAWSGQVEFEGSADGIEFKALNLTPINSTTPAALGTTNKVWVGSCGGLMYVQARCSSFVSGRIDATIVAALAGGSSGGSGGGGSSDATAANQVTGNGYLASLIAQIFDFDTSGATSNGPAFGILTPGNPPVPVSSSNPLPTYTGPLTAIAPAAYSVTNASGAAVALNVSRKYVDLCNTDASKTVYLGFGANAAVVGSGVTLAPGAPARIQTTQPINAVADASGGANLAIQEWQ